MSSLGYRRARGRAHARGRHVVCAAAACALALLLAAGSAASAAIVMNRGIDGVRVDDTAKQVIARLGPPPGRGTCDRYSGMWPCGRAIQFWSYPSRELNLLLLHGRVAQIDTASRAERTSSGVGPGESLRYVEHAYPHGAKGTLGSSIYGYFLHGFPRHDGDLFTAAYVSGDSHGRVTDLAVGRWQQRYACDFFACQ